MTPAIESTKVYPGQFGNMVKLRPVSITNTKTNTKKTRVVRITEYTWEKLRDFSCKNHDQPITYDEIFEELVDFYTKNHEQKWFLT